MADPLQVEPGDESLEAPAYLGRPFPGTRSSRSAVGSTTRGLTLLLPVSLIGALVSLTGGNVLAAAGFALFGVGVLLTAFFLVRREIRREAAIEGRPGRFH